MSFPRRIKAATKAALFAFALLGSPAAATAQTASPQEIALAKQTAKDGLVAYQAGQYDKALSLFEQARAVYPSAQVLRLEGYSLLALDRWMPAAEAMDAALVSEIGPLDAEDKADVEQQLAKAMAHIGVVNISSTVPGAKLSVDGGEPMALPLNKPLRMAPGAHAFVVTAPEHDDAKEEITLEGGKPVDKVLDPIKKKPVEVEPPKPPPPPPPPKKGWFPMQREIGFGAAGVGVALGGATLMTALMSANIRSNVATDVDIHKKNYGESCDRGDYSLCVFDRAVINNDADRADALRNAALGMGIAAGVLAASGVVLIVFSGDSSAKPAPKDTPADGAAAARRTEAPTRVACGLAGGVGLSCAGTF